MTERTLERYTVIKREIQQLEECLKEGIPKVSDVVHSGAEFPFNQHNVVVTGADEKLYARWQTQLSRNKQLKAEIEMFVESVPDDQVRLAMRYRYYKGLPWQTVAMRCGWIDPETPSRKIKNFLEQPDSIG